MNNILDNYEEFHENAFFAMQIEFVVYCMIWLNQIAGVFS